MIVRDRAADYDPNIEVRSRHAAVLWPRYVRDDAANLYSVGARPEPEVLAPSESRVRSLAAVRVRRGPLVRTMRVASR